ncbi:SusE domain-containing protein [Pedobacter duraquae]|uniref:Uncharacterized protein DUF5019 n=1 Tax=Pedobacter duraquae TaxID=425511 RepID=A0A4R6IIF1_9SPHI|nr:SusE domain-containing protein [Pedobacter duraquae]TDO21733.1 uncharacterized protein DUF5019 [Pedobacter duraquae]
MKSILLKTVAFSLIAVSLWSCKKDGDLTVSNVSSAGTLTASSTTVALAQANATKPAVTLTFPAATVTGYKVPVASTLQFDVKGNNFAAPKEYVITTTTYSPTVADFNAMVLALGIKAAATAQIEVRLKSAPAPNSVTYSNVVTLSTSPYLAAAWIYVPGAYQGWAPETADSLVSKDNNGVYTGIINYTAGNLGFKITPAKNWNLAYGDAGAGLISTTGGDLNAGVAGKRQLTVDLNKKTIEFAAVKAWTIIGDATPKGWDADTDLKFINDANGVWRATVDLKVGAFKFRNDGGWTLSLGAGATAGTLSATGGDIPLTTAGNYTITLNVSALTYTLVKN